MASKSEIIITGFTIVLNDACLAFKQMLKVKIVSGLIFVSFVLLAKSQLKKQSGHLLIILVWITSYSFAGNAQNNILCALNPVVAHRGAWKKNNLPQNSIASLKHAIELKCAGSEFDVRMTADDILIINHDPEYNKLPIEKTKFKYLAVFKLANGEKLPTFQEYMKAGMKNNTSTRLVCEIKPSEISKERGKAVAEKVLKLVHKLKAEHMVVYISFDYDILKRILELNPKAITQYLEGDKSPDQLNADGISGADFHYSVFVEHPAWIEKAKQNNITLNAWTVNEADDIDWLIANNFDYITTNEPELLLERLKKSPTASGWKLKWSDEFNYTGSPDSTKWIYDTEGNSSGWGNNEAQFYTIDKNENASVENGKLTITAIREDIEGHPYSSARLNSKADWQYGRIEVRAKLPASVGTWPAIWMMPGGWTFKDGNWPDIGEIDIMEHVGYDLNVVHASAHSRDYQWHKGTQRTAVITVPGATDNFHNYILEWSSEVMKIYVDDSCYFTYKNEGAGESKWPYNKPFYLILNLAIGGAWGSVKGIDEAAFPQTMSIDYVRAYKKD